MDYRIAGDGGLLSSPQVAASHALQAASFGAAASAYAEHRPDYPVTAIEWALAPLAARPVPPGRPRGPARILDLGAGTGKLTVQIASLAVAGRSPRVIAVEPDQKMLAEFRRRLPGVTALAGRAEAIPLRDASVDAVLAGQAAHWFDLDVAMPEIARVLAPGGVIAGLWNTNDERVDWVAGLHEMSGRDSMAVVTQVAERDSYGIFGWLDGIGRSFFRPPDHATFPHAQRRTADSLIDTMRTHSVYLVMEAVEREAVLAAVREYLAATPQTACGEFSLPISTFAIRTVRRRSRFAATIK